MRLETFFGKFELFADAPNAVEKMRELVLQLALNGGLVGLDSSNWERVPLGTLGDWGSGGTPLRSEPQYYGGAIPWLVIGDLNDGIVTSASTFITEEGLANSSARILPRGVLLIAMYGSIGKLGITGIECATNQAIAFCKPDPKRADLKYLFHTIKAIQPALLARGQGLAQKNISQTILKAWEIALPPLAEQKRIVAKVDELMALCDRLEAQQQERDTRHAVLAHASLARFAEAPTSANLDFLFHQSYPITPADLRKSILTLAVQGKLVGSSEDSSSWPLVKMREVCLQITDGEHATPQRTSSGIPLATAKNVRDGFLDLSATDWVAPVTAEKCWKRCKPRHDDLLMVCVGATTGRVCLVQNPPDMVLVRSVALIRPNPERIAPTYLNLFLRSPTGQSQIWGNVKQSAQPCLYLGRMSEFEIVLPALAEQRRIVAKVDQLLALVDQLETQLTEAKTKSAALLDAVIHELLNPTAAIVDLASYRTAIGCYAIQKMAGKRYFGRTAAMKALYLAEAHVGLALGLKPLREAAGPFDQWIYRFEDEGEREGWFKPVSLSTSDGKTKIEYRPGRALPEKSLQAEQILTLDQRKEFDRLLALFSVRTTEEAEIIATLFAAWNDFLIDGHEPSDDEIVREVRENWHEKKERFTPALLRKWLGWLRQNDVVPKGRTPRTMHQTQLLLN